MHRSSNAADGVSRYLLVQGIGRYDFVTVNYSGDTAPKSPTNSRSTEGTTECVKHH